jgi:tRNA(adenine34) deaminase
MSASPTHFMQEALKVATEGLEKGELPIGAVVVLDGQVIARAHTAERAEQRMLVHAELLALLEADMLLGRSSQRAHVMLFTNLEPCLMCMGAAMSFFLGQIYYALEAPRDGAVALAHQWQRKKKIFQHIVFPLWREACSGKRAWITSKPMSSAIPPLLGHCGNGPRRWLTLLNTCRLAIRTNPQEG